MEKSQEKLHELRASLDSAFLLGVRDGFAKDLLERAFTMSA